MAGDAVRPGGSGVVPAAAEGAAVRDRGREGLRHQLGRDLGVEGPAREERDQRARVGGVEAGDVVGGERQGLEELYGTRAAKL